MRTLLLPLLFSACLISQSTNNTAWRVTLPEVSQRHVTVDGVAYRVVYEPGVAAWIPATTNAQIHWNASISVFRGDRQLGESFSGQWTEGGCFEDDPQTLVRMVLEKQPPTFITLASQSVTYAGITFCGDVSLAAAFPACDEQKLPACPDPREARTPLRKADGKVFAVLCERQKK